MNKYFILGLLALTLHYNSYSQTGLTPGNCNTSLAYFDDYSDGFIVLRDGTKINGEISIKSYEKEGRITLTDKSGTKYKVNVNSLQSWGLNRELPVCYSPFSWFDWKNQKRKNNDHAERGFVVLTNGETKDGKIKIEGNSYDGDLAGENYFAIDKLTFVDVSGQETVYNRDQIKGYGRILPWALTPSELYSWQNGEFMGKRKTKFKPGYCITNDGKRIEGNMQLIVNNKLPRKGKNGENTDKTRSDIVDEIRFERDGNDEKVNLDDVFAYGLDGMSINTLTNNRDRLYNIDEMNFHEGTITTTDNKTMKGFIAYFPEPGNYYGVYYAAKADEPVKIFPMKEIKSAVQDISLIEAYDDGSAPVKKTNTNINGYIVDQNMKKYEGTVTLVEDNDFWVRSIDFTDKDGHMLKYGGSHAQIAYTVVNGNIYAQHETVFMKAEKMASPFILYNNPHPDNQSKGSKFGAMLGKAIIKEVVTDQVTKATWSAQARNNWSMKGVSIDGKRADGLNFGYNVGNAASDGVLSIISKAGRPKENLPYKAKRGEDFLILNLLTGESVSAGDSDNWETLLEGCSKYWALSSKEQKNIVKSGNAAALDYLNNCYGNK